MFLSAKKKQPTSCVIFSMLEKKPNKIMITRNFIMTMLRKKSIEISLKYVHHTYHVYIDVVFFVIAACHQWVITTKICDVL
jgi:hypothetical protein